MREQKNKGVRPRFWVECVGLACGMLVLGKLLPVGRGGVLSFWIISFVAGLAIIGDLLPNKFIVLRSAFHRKQIPGLAKEAFSDRRISRFVLQLVPARSRDYLVGDLEEEYREIACKCGAFRARCWWWGQVMGVIGSYLWARMRRALGVAALRKFLR